MIHHLKTWPAFFDPIADKLKTFEVRRDDGRGFAVGDVLLLEEWDPETETYTGRRVRAAISYVMKGGALGVGASYVVLALFHVGAVETYEP